METSFLLTWNTKRPTAEGGDVANVSDTHTERFPTGNKAVSKITELQTDSTVVWIKLDKIVEIYNYTPARFDASLLSFD